ncbi:hypothetical protein MNV59_06025 [Lactiplantibacillus plantarum]|uniref:hypothetical protein n=1 Tax=Lactiplantibacillus plantarum TaxID=1590 RepID=UPI001081C280|nr:hypothetical protein [Lactiplantibacillus plantarum]MBP5841648.1 hypothetical protein [Lactiplantibacillus plantarum]MCH8624316.1 hypothetical protein [Lactiplantibacillus plantarum]MCH8632298.1 hypothetical protein [Lactiplantibacillus plantarum]QKX09121.1 hypothetical protein Heal19_500515 [Lactiplantibacillus plantarum]
MDYNCQQAMVQMGIPVSVYEEEDFMRINQVMLAKPREDRVQDPMAALKAAGLTIGGSIKA